MKKFNYNEPEFKVVNMSKEDVLTGSLDVVDTTWDTKPGGGGIDVNDLFNM